MLYITSGTVENNTAVTAGNEIYPENNVTIDSTEPTIVINKISEEWTNEDVVVTMYISDDVTGIKQVTVDGEIITETDAVYTYTAKENGTYKVVAVDNSGNEATEQFTIAYIDKEAPVIIGVIDKTTYNEEISINATDTLSGIKSVTLIKDNAEIEYTLGETISESGEYTITVKDNVSNISIVSFTIDRSLKDDEIKIDGISTEWTNSDQVITIKINNEIQSIKINGKEVELTNNTYALTVTENGTYAIEITDLDGRIITKTIEITNIDKTDPIIYGIIDETTYDKTVNIIVRDEESGIFSIILTKDGKESEISDTEFEILENGEYIIKVTDNAGNETKTSFTLNISKTEGNSSNTGEEDSMNEKEAEEIDDETIDYSSSGTDGGKQEIEEKSVDTTTMSGTLPNTGTRGKVLIFITIIVTFLLGLKYRKYKNITK